MVGAASRRCGNDQQSEIDAATVLFPITVTCGIQTIATAEFFCNLRDIRLHRSGLRCGSGFGCRGLGREGLAYHRGSHHACSVNPAPMRDNPLSTETSFAGLSDHRMLALVGRDATAFAHAQFMNDVAALPDQHWQWNGWLTPKGRVTVLFALLRFDAETLWLLLPDADPAALALQLQRFVFRSKVAIAAREDLRVSGAFAMPLNASGSTFAGHAQTHVELDLTGEGGARTLRISGDEASAVPGNMSRWAAFDMMHGLPRLPDSQSGQWTPQQLSLDRLHAYSVKKGCYPGQEIVARTHFLGQAKRELALFDTNAAVTVGSDVQDGERAIGTVVSTTSPDSEKHIALAVLPLDREPAALHVEAISLSERPLLGGLAR